MVRLPESCDQKLQGGAAAVCDLKKGPWTPEEDQKLVAYIQTNGHGSWRTLPRQAGLARCGKSCRLRWSNYLRPGIKRGGFSPQEDDSIIQLHALLGNRWSTIATHLPGRTDNEIKNHWNTKLRKRLMKMGIDPTTHRPCLQPPVGPQIPSINAILLSLLQQQPQKYIDLPNHVDSSSILKYLLLQGSLPMNTSTFSNHVPPLSNTSPSIVGMSPSMASSFPNIDPTLLNAAQSFLMLEYLRLGSSGHEEHMQPTGLDYQLNQAITRLVLVKLLQQQGTSSTGNSTSPCPRFDGEISTNGSLGKGSQLSTESPMDYLMHDRRGQNMQVAMGTHFPHGSMTMTTNDTNPTYVNNMASLSPPENCGMPPPNVLTSMNNSAFQQRLLHLFPFLGESILESCKTNANDDLSSNQLPKSTYLDVFTPPCSTTTPTCHQKQMMWPTNEGNRQIASSSLPFFSGFSSNLMPTWDVPSLSGVDVSKDMASSSTIKKTSSSSTISSASTPPTTIVTPSTPSTNNISNVQDYWSSLLNLFSPNINHQS